MEHDIYPENERKPLSALVHELGGSLKDLMDSELHLVKEEAKANTAALSTQYTKLALFAGLILLGSLAFLAFLVIGLGQLMNDRYWLSALIIALLFVGTGTAFGIQAFHAINWKLWTFPQSQESLRRDLNSISAKFGEIKRAIERRAI